ncbi:sensor histidine kinase [Carboxylicivirga marina]|uniref:histidine kinase n=1 Tax=Carboxylicivirga marina TaxID=2800988 RepID=A0ABS1HNV0_9BACT|nr:HAMP domain-containing sensor histidine kinase [Carboxylicivirga marina]MBK3519275.1 HAMP domain-containing histidine kinase [Carboxylicivirga marina]
MGWLSKLWQSISYNGIESSRHDTIKRTTVLNNQVNATLFLIMVGISVLLWVLRVIEDRTMNIGGWRFYWIMCLCIIHFFLSRFKFHTLAKSLLIFIPPILFLIVPALFGFVEDQSFFYYTYIVVAFSLFPQLLLRINTNRILYRGAMLYYLVFMFSLDYILVYFAPKELAVIPMLEDFWIFNKIASISIYTFINSSVYYLKWVNYKFEKQLKANQVELLINNKRLDVHIEELKATNEHLKTTQQQLIHSEKMASLGVLTAGVAHEINTPLNFISTGSLLVRNAIEDSQNGNDTDEVNKMLHQGNEIINKGVEQAAFVVSSLMTFSYSGKSQKSKHDLHSILDSTLMFLKAKMPADLIVEKNYTLDEPVTIYADKIHQVALNIIDNAISALDNVDSKILKISCDKESNKREGNYACISIFNNGPQINNKVGARIFDPFYTTKSINKGTGLGLSLAYNLVEEHGGFLSFNNHPDGVEFMIKLPM